MDIELNKLKGKKIIVIGDLMLDTYHIGEVKRISPEAPVPVVRVSRSYSVLGGAANVARNLLGLECVPHVIGTVGDDYNGQLVRQMFNELDVVADLDLSDSPTITKTRIIGNNQQIVRIDFEQDKGVISSSNEVNLIRAFVAAIEQSDLVIISDYGKGVCSERVCSEVISIARNRGKMVVVDPKGTQWDKYRGATVITPNLKELSDVSGVEVKNDDTLIHSAAKSVVERFDLLSLLVTRSEKGMSYIDSKIVNDIPTQAKEVYDVSGAGDTVVATLGAAMAAGFDVMDAIWVANKAAGIVVGKIGTTPILFDELQRELSQGYSVGKIITESQLTALVDRLHTQGRRVVFTNGCFDILHKGHVVYLEKAKAMGDILILGLNSDSSVKRLKGESRPINDEVARSYVLAALECVDYVVLFEEDTPLNLIRIIKPDLLVKGGDYKIEDIVGREYAKDTAVISFVEGFSTTGTINKIDAVR